jgi:hypothetical protein
MPESKTVTNVARSVAKMRSPSYPGVNLETAIKRATGFYQKERRNSAPYAVAASHWGFGAKSSGGLVTVAALKAFGLIKELEKGASGRMIQLSDLAFRIILDTREDSPERMAAIREAALRPRLHGELWRKYRTAEGVSDANLRHDLIFNWKFNENTVDEFIREYRETIRYAKLSESDKLSDEVEDKEEGMIQGEELVVDAMENELYPTPGNANKLMKVHPKPNMLATQVLAISIPRNLCIDIAIRGDELRKDDLAKIKNQFNRWIEGLEEAFEE